MKLFTMYRQGRRPKTHNRDQYNSPSLPQFEGVIFSDGKVAIRWMTNKASTAIFDSLDDMMDIHGHPEYNSKIVWHNLK